MVVFGAPVCVGFIVAVTAGVLLLGELCVFETLLFLRLIPCIGLLVTLFLCVALAVFFLPTLRVMIRGPSDKREWIGTSDGLDVGRGPKRRET